jgi:hypothetical protein
MNSILSTVSFRLTLGKFFLGIECIADTDGFSVHRVLFNQAKSFKEKEPLTDQTVSSKRIGKMKTEKYRKRSLFCIIRSLLLRFPFMINKIFRCFHLKQCQMEGILGLGDPALTGQIYGLFKGSSYMVNGPFDVLIYPEFSKSVVNGSVHIIFHFIFAHLLWAGLSVGWRLLSVYRKC